MRCIPDKDTFNIAIWVTIIPEDLEASGLILTESANHVS